MPYPLFPEFDDLRLTRLGLIPPPTKIEVAKKERDQARIDHDAASAFLASYVVSPRATVTTVEQAKSRLTSARSALYAADAKLAALVRKADVKAKIEKVEAAKKQTLSDVEAVLDNFEDEDNSLEYNLDRDWDFLDDEAKEQLIRAVKSVLGAYHRRIKAS